MRKTPLQKAIDCLEIQDVFQISAVANIADRYDPKYMDEDLGLQFKHIVTRSEVIEVSENDEKDCLFRVHIDVGTRWVEKIDEVEESDDNENDNPSIMAMIEATFVAEYRLTDKPGKKALDAFALKNASYHIWPYWREYFMAQSMRMNLPKLALPTVQFAANRDDDNSAKSERE